MKIGITIAKSNTQQFINQAYIDYIHEAGYEPILICNHNNINSMVTLCDGLLLPGGIDVDPVYYGEENFSSNATSPERDQFEREVLSSFIEERKPVFGICRGFQLIVREVLHKYSRLTSELLTFNQHINGHNLSATLNISRQQPAHAVSADIKTLYGASKSVGKIFVNSMHHQCLYHIPDVLKKEIGPIRILGISKYGLPVKSTGCIIEAVDIILDNIKSIIRGVQWHPEELKDYALIQNFFGNTEKLDTQQVGGSNV